MSDLTLTTDDRDQLAEFLDGYAAQLEADITGYCVPGTDEPMPEDAGFVAEKRALWRTCQDWIIRIDNPDSEFDPAEPKGAKSIP